MTLYCMFATRLSFFEETNFSILSRLGFIFNGFWYPWDPPTLLASSVLDYCATASCATAVLCYRSLCYRWLTMLLLSDATVSYATAVLCYRSFCYRCLRYATICFATKGLGGSLSRPQRSTNDAQLQKHSAHELLVSSDCCRALVSGVWYQVLEVGHSWRQAFGVKYLMSST